MSQNESKVPIVSITVLEVEVEFYLVTGGSQAQPGQAGWRLLTSLQVDNSGLLKLKVKNKRFSFSTLFMTQLHSYSWVNSISSIYCLNIWPSSAGGRWIPDGGEQGESLMAAAESSGSAHSSPGHQWMPFAGSDNDHPEPTHPPTHVHPAHRWTTYLRPGCRRDAGLIKFIGAKFATAVWLIFTNQIIHEETAVNEEYISDFTKRPLRWENYFAQVCFVKDIKCNIFEWSCLKKNYFCYTV